MLLRSRTVENIENIDFSTKTVFFFFGGGGEIYPRMSRAIQLYSEVSLGDAPRSKEPERHICVMKKPRNIIWKMKIGTKSTQLRSWLHTRSLTEECLSRDMLDLYIVCTPTCAPCSKYLMYRAYAHINPSWIDKDNRTRCFKATILREDRDNWAFGRCMINL